MSNLRGNLFVISGPSGVGKDTISKDLYRRNPRLVRYPSITTRCQREGEYQGIDYQFVTREHFAKLVEADTLLEYAEVHGNMYGTDRGVVEDTLKRGRDCLLVIDVQGAITVKEKMPEAILIFIAPPSMEALEQRLRGRKTESDESINLRLSNAIKEMRFIPKYDYLVVNDTPYLTTERVYSILTASKYKIKCDGGDFNVKY